ncbi:MAG: nucleotide pyrophosphohydrolase [Syntrophales bacterium]
MKIKDLQNEIIDFRDKRNWKQFHKVKDLLLGLNIEISELSELFLWKNANEINSTAKHRVEEEIADVFILLTYICNHFGIELEHAVKKKIEMNNKKYPIEKSFNSNKKYNEFD